MSRETTIKLMKTCAGTGVLAVLVGFALFVPVAFFVTMIVAVINGTARTEPMLGDLSLLISVVVFVVSLVLIGRTAIYIWRVWRPKATPPASGTV